MDRHAILQDLKRVAADLGRAPTRQEFRDLGETSERSLVASFGGFSAALHAAGLERTIQRKKERLKELFRADVADMIGAHQSVVRARSGVRRMLALGDLHHPFSHSDSLSAVYEIAERMKPEVIVQGGDLYDMFAHGRFPRSRCAFNPLEEVELGFKMASEMWATLRRICPLAECHQILGNHDVRPLKRILEAYPEGEPFFSIDKYFQFDGVTSHLDSRKELEIDGVLFMHGFLSRPGAHLAYNQANTVWFHTHKGMVIYRPYRNQTLWELNAGFLGDPESKALSYTPQKLTNWTLGVGWIDGDGPRFIPF